MEDMNSTLNCLINATYEREILVRRHSLENYSLTVATSIWTRKFPRYAEWSQLERRLVCEVVGERCEIHKTQYLDEKFRCF